jgi:hypothetical protein
MHPPLLTRLLLLLIQFAILALALPNLDSKIDHAAADLVDSMLDPPTDPSPLTDTSPSAEVQQKEGVGKVEKRKRPPMLRRSSSWASSREKVEFAGVLGSGRWLGG